MKYDHSRQVILCSWSPNKKKLGIDEIPSSWATLRLATEHIWISRKSPWTSVGKSIFLHYPMDICGSPVKTHGYPWTYIDIQHRWRHLWKSIYFCSFIAWCVVAGWSLVALGLRPLGSHSPCTRLLICCWSGVTALRTIACYSIQEIILWISPAISGVTPIRGVHERQQPIE